MIASASQPHLFIVGLGFVGERVGLRAEELGWRVSGSCRTAEKAKIFRQRSGIAAHAFDLDDEYVGLNGAGLDALGSATHVLATMPPIADLSRDPLLALHREALLRAACDGGGPLRWAGYLSTTSVYGDHAGGWVDEDSPCLVGSESPAAYRLRAEAEWLGLHEASEGRLATRAFRLAGIYGPGRSALETVIRRGGGPLLTAPSGRGRAAQLLPDEAALAAAVARAATAGEASSASSSSLPLDAASLPGSSDRRSPVRYVSRIHVSDIASALLASMAATAAGAAAERRAAAPAIYNLADDEPAPRGEVMAYAAALLGATSEAAVTAADSGGDSARARRRATESKRVGNQRMREELLPGGLAFPTYREGLRQLALDAIGE